MRFSRSECVPTEHDIRRNRSRPLWLGLSDFGLVEAKLADEVAQSVDVGLRWVLAALGQEGVSFQVVGKDNRVGIVFDGLLCAIQVDLHVPVTFFAEKH